MSQGVEWAVHCCLLLDWLDAEPMSTARLARGHGLAPTYLNKQLQSLVRARILDSTAGPRGGFRLARPLDRITLMDVVTAIEGSEEAFRCTEIRQNGPGADTPERAYRSPCAVSIAMHRAELAWRRALAGQTLADVRDEAIRHSPALKRKLQNWYATH